MTGATQKPPALKLTEEQKGTTFLDKYFGEGSTEATFIIAISLIVWVIWHNLAMFFATRGNDLAVAQATYHKENERNIKAIMAETRATAELAHLMKLKETGTWTQQPSQTSSPSLANTSVPDLSAKPLPVASSLAASPLQPPLPTGIFPLQAPAPLLTPGAPSPLMPNLQPLNGPLLKPTV